MVKIIKKTRGWQPSPYLIEMKRLEGNIRIFEEEIIPYAEKKKASTKSMKKLVKNWRKDLNNLRKKYLPNVPSSPDGRKENDVPRCKEIYISLGEERYCNNIAFYMFNDGHGNQYPICEKCAGSFSDSSLLTKLSRLTYIG